MLLVIFSMIMGALALYVAVAIYVVCRIDWEVDPGAPLHVVLLAILQALTFLPAHILSSGCNGVARIEDVERD